MRHALTFDVEEYFQVSNFETLVPRETWDDYPSRVVESTRGILDLLDDAGVRATFFVLGWVAERQPDLVREIRDLGHEIASHGYWHRLVYDCSPDEFREDVSRTRSILADICGVAPRGYRAPSFSITPRSSWALSILAETGHEYDSSVFPVAHPRYGWKGADPYPHERATDGDASIWELPPTTAPFAGRRLPAAGGAYLRLLPLRLIHRGLRAAERAGQPGMLYLHPWEFDPDQPRLKVGRLTRARHYGNIARTADRLRRLLAEFDFGPAERALDEVRAAS